jgi:hypothetical protein
MLVLCEEMRRSEGGRIAPFRGDGTTLVDASQRRLNDRFFAQKIFAKCAAST